MELFERAFLKYPAILKVEYYWRIFFKFRSTIPRAVLRLKIVMRRSKFLVVLHLDMVLILKIILKITVI
jgi:hypothetical protein